MPDLEIAKATQIYFSAVQILQRNYWNEVKVMVLRDWSIDYWGLTPEQQYFSYIRAMTMKWMIKWTWNDDDDDDEMEIGMRQNDSRVDKFWLLLEKWRDG